MNTFNRPFVKYLLVIPIILILLAIFLLSRKNNMQISRNTQVVGSPTPSSQNFDLGTIGTPYQTSQFKVTYPKTWKITDSQTQLNGANYSNWNIESQGVAGNPMFYMERYELSQKAAVKQNFEDLKTCTQENITINGNQFPDMQCLMYVRMVHEKPVQIVTQLHIVFFEKPNALYIARFYYSSPRQDAIYENLFNQMLSSLQISQ